MVRTQVQLGEKQAELAKALAAQRGVSMAEIIRASLDAYLAASQQPDRQELRRRARLAAGIVGSGLSDLSVNHDEYLAEAYGQ
jgi:hypothetical protein